MGNEAEKKGINMRNQAREPEASQTRANTEPGTFSDVRYGHGGSLRGLGERGNDESAHETHCDEVRNAGKEKEVRRRGQKRKETITAENKFPSRGRSIFTSKE